MWFFTGSSRPRPVTINNTALIVLLFVLLIQWTNNGVEGRQRHRKKREVSTNEPLVPNGSSENKESLFPSKPKDQQGGNHNGGTPGGTLYLPKNYNRLEIPSFKRVFMMNDHDDDMNLDAEIKIKIRDIREIDELSEEITLEIDFRVSWPDAMILFNGSSFSEESIDSEAFLASLNQMTEAISAIAELNETTINKESITLEPSFLAQIWTPDVFIENVVSINRPALMSKPMRLRFHPKGVIRFSSRLTVKVDCEMEFEYYPADTQNCVFKLRSYSHTNDELKVNWAEHKPIFLYERSDPNFDVQLHSVKNYEVEEEADEGINEKFSVLEFSISARRKMSYHMVQTFLPSVFFIIITWLCFLIPSRMVEARIGISMTTLLSLTSMFSSSRESTPIVSYVKAIDIWMVSCIFFVFLTLLEFTVLVWLRYVREAFEEREENKMRERQKMMTHDLRAAEEKGSMELQSLTQPKDEPTGVTFRGTKESPNDIDKLDRKASVCTLELKKKVNTAEKAAELIENYSFVTFSILFIIYNFIFWPWLLSASNYFGWEVDMEYNSPMEDD